MRARASAMGAGRRNRRKVAGAIGVFREGRSSHSNHGRSSDCSQFVETKVAEPPADLPNALCN